MPAATISEVLKPTTIEKLRRDATGEVWVLNNTARLPNMQAGLAVISVTMNNGDPRIVRIPNTYIPVDVSQQLPKSMLIDSPDFLNAVMRRALLLIDPASAAEYFAQDIDGSQAELDRITQDLMGGGRFSEAEIPAGFALQEIEGEIDPDLNIAVAEAIARDDISESELLSVVRNNMTQLGRKDFEYIVHNTNWPKVKMLAADSLARLPKQQGARVIG